ncbi:uncharacterized protein LOC123668796 [Melitaea cinxia]|uniref:uncharacterized protein LOC123668796 n=1 Tax=Melitaea cinxia TaxID=113334 RepID=UPI001E2706CD|nr:uncharacterized protein LOC123668796 [Melitaea cinxia]
MTDDKTDKQKYPTAKAELSIIYNQGSCLSQNKIFSVPELIASKKQYKTTYNSKSLDDLFFRNTTHFKSDFLVYIIPKLIYQNKEYHFLNNPVLKIYRCQLNTNEESCCCSCNSDAMFEVMKSLYDCYKKKNCDNCNCILCGHLPREERRLGELRKSSVSVTKVEGEKRKKSKEIIKQKISSLKGKNVAEKEKILRDLIKSGAPLPQPKTKSDKEIIKRVQTELRHVGLPPEPKTASDKKKYDKALEMGLITPLLGKSASEKEKVLQGQADLGLKLPEGHTESEQKLIAKIKAAKIEPSELKVPSSKLRKSKAEGIRTTLQGKTPEEKEKIIKDLAMKGIPLPDGKSASDKKLIDKVRAEIGLPPQPKTSSSKENYAKAQGAGLIVPLEGKTESQKEKLLKEQAKLGLSLPEGRTPSEKALIAKVKAQTPAVVTIASDKIKSTKKGVGLLTPLHGKTLEQKENILKDLAMHNIPLPEPKTPSEKLAADKVRNDLGLPPEPKSKKEVSKYNQAVAAGLITPLEGKTQAEKEKILQGQADLGLQLPEGRSPSEKALIKKVKAKKKKHRGKVVEGILPPDKRQKLDDKTRKVLKEGKGPSDECICRLISPESDKVIESKSKATKTKDIKTPSQKEKIIRELAKQGAPLPVPKTHSEKKILDKIQADLGLPPVPSTPSLKEKYVKAQKEGIIVPLEGKTPSQKEIILKKQAKMGITLPEGRTPSETALVNKIRTAVKPESIASKKLWKAKEAGILTPLTGKSPDEQIRILRNIAKAGLPLPEGKTSSEKQIIQKVKDDMGLPSKGIPSELFRKAKAAGLITPLGDKTQEQKEKILRDRVAMGLPLPDGITPSDKQLIKKIKTSPEIKPLSEKIRLAKAAGLLTPLEGKSPEQKEKVLKGLVKAGLPLPDGKSPSEKKLIEKVREEVGLPPKPKTSSMHNKMKQAHLAGIITPLEGKTSTEKEKILKKMHVNGIPLPKGRTPSEKSLIEKIKADVKLKARKEPSKIEKPKSKDLLTPLEGKTPTQKEKVIRELIKSGQPLPEGKTRSELALINKIKAEMGLIMPPEKVQKLDKKTAKTMKEGKGPSDECICHILSPEVRKEKSAEALRVPSERFRKAKETGLLTPLQGKSIAEKEKILKGLAMQGIPLPEAKTTSEKKLINKIRADVGLPPEPKTSSLKQKYNKAIAAGLITPLQGKSIGQKEKILKGQAQMGLPLPEGRTPSEKSLIQKVKTDYEKPSKTRIGALSEKKGKIKTKSKKIEVAAERLSGKRLTKTKGAITEEFEDIIKTTTCDKGCGCDKKKIRFKHSYVKIRVTSPDISSLCPCPEECLPGVKGGVFTDNEGIKVTVGRAIGIPSFSSRKSFLSDVNLKLYKTFFKPSYAVLSTTELLTSESAFSLFGYHYNVANRSPRNETKSEIKINKESCYMNEIYQKYYNNYSFDRMDIESNDKHINLQTFKENRCKKISFQEFSVTDTSQDTNYKTRKHRTLKIKENCRIISTDTTQDRPCCCEVSGKLDVPSDVCQDRMDNIVTEILTPIILKEADALGTQNQIRSETPNSSRALCNNCGAANKSLQKKVNLLCPCEHHQIFSEDNHTEHQQNKNKKCKCKEKKLLKKNIICECPEEPEPEIDLSEWIDEKQMRKLKSELTQTRSGFKINKPRRKYDLEKSDLDMNFEDILKYIANNLEEENNKYNKDVCDCSSNLESKSKNITNCECPYEEPPSQIQTEETSKEEPFTGIKFHISGKGSGSKGLNGILCFNLLNDFSKQI